jgi:hypothetical protein|tara:strand:+ start:514 stop:1023 length:510 start_codon:yes stop_codon:yes gene_type:complete
MNIVNSSNKGNEYIKSLAKSNFQRPQTTYTDTLQNKDAMAAKLINYERVESIEDVDLSTHVRYVTLSKTKKQVFRTGGLLERIHTKYATLNNGSHRWSVQRFHYENENGAENGEDPIFETVFFRRITKREELNKKEQHYKSRETKLMELIQKQNNKIKQLENRINGGGY